jgi:transcriptional regulator
VIEDGAEVEALLRRLTDVYEGEGGFAVLPRDLVARMSRGIVAFALPIERLTGKAKLSQNKTAGDRAGVIRGLEAQGDAGARDVAALLRGLA